MEPTFIDHTVLLNCINQAEIGYFLVAEAKPLSGVEAKFWSPQPERH